MIARQLKFHAQMSTFCRVTNCTLATNAILIYDRQLCAKKGVAECQGYHFVNDWEFERSRFGSVNIIPSQNKTSVTERPCN